jgi:hypothetical protein
MSDEVKTRCRNRIQHDQPTVPDVVSRILARTGLARFMELYYWSQEPGLLEIIRAVSAMPESAREALESFVAMGGDPGSVVASWTPGGRLSLEARGVGETLAVIKYLMEDPNGLVRNSEPH